MAHTLSPKVYFTPQEHDAALENPGKPTLPRLLSGTLANFVHPDICDTIGSDLCLLCLRSFAAALVEHYDGAVTTSRLPRETAIALPCYNLIDQLGGYRRELFGRCSPVESSPAVTSECIVAPNLPLLECVYNASTEMWHVDQSVNAPLSQRLPARLLLTPGCRRSSTRARQL